MSKEILPGQIWQERDNRFERFVRVLHVGDKQVNIETVELEPKAGWYRKRGTRDNWASIERFDGRYGGYMLHQFVS